MMLRLDVEIPEKISFEGRIVSVQVRSTVWRYRLDNRTHREIGYNLFLKGTVIGDDTVLDGKTTVCYVQRVGSVL